MREILHFNSEKEKIAYLRGQFKEVTPVEVSDTPKEVEETASDEPLEEVEEEAEETEEGIEDEVQAE